MKQNSSFIVAYFLILCSFFFSCTPKETADMVIVNGKVATVDSSFSIQEAVAVKGRKIIYVGKSSEVEQYIGDSTQVIDAQNMLVLPGLIDAHAHLVSLGNQLSQLYTSDCQTYEEVIERVKVAAAKAKPGEWIIGGRWDQNKWQPAEFPLHDALSAVSPDNPVYLSRIDGNSALVNQKAFPKEAGIQNKRWQ